MLKRLLPAAAVGAIVAAVYLAGGLQFVERPLADVRFAMSPAEASSDLVLVAVDPDSIERLGHWPWPRQYHASLIDELSRAGARAVAFDIDFSSRSNLEDDGELALAIAESRVPIYLPVFRQLVQDGGRRTIAIDAGPLSELRQYGRLGSINIQPERDGLVRGYRWEWPFEEGRVPSLAAALAEPRERKTGRFLIDFGIDPRSIETVSYFDALTGQYAPETFDDKAVLIGATAVELGDSLAVPRHSSLPGPLIQALAYESIFQGRTLTSVPREWGVIGTLLVAVLTGLAMRPSGWRVNLALTLAAGVVVMLASLVLHDRTRFIVEVSPWILSLAGVFVVQVARSLDSQTFKLWLQRMRLDRSETFMRHVADHSLDALLVFSDRLEVERANAAAAEMFGYPESGLVGLNVRSLLLVPDVRSGTPLPLRSEPFEAIGRRRDGGTLPVELSVSRLEHEGASRRFVFARDITHRKRQRRQLEHQASHDALTDLPNRYLLGRRFEAALAAARAERIPVAFMLLDLDRFKEINDTLGHHTGDVLLKLIAARLRDAVREGDTIARFGGDEFAVLLPATDAEGAREIADRLTGRLERSFQMEGLSLKVDTSIGIAQFPEHGGDAATLIQRADVAMYVAKRGRLGTAVYREDQDFTSVRQLTLTGDLRQAIESGGLHLHFQPKLHVGDGRVVGVEALVRWNHPVHGDVPAHELIEIAERSGLIRPLTRWVLHTALSQTAEWRAQGIDLGVAINISASLLEEKLSSAVLTALTATGLPAGVLTLEITESVIMDDPERALHVATELDALGVRISIDDFGTGYSSLGYLKRLPASEIKIDKSFVIEMDDDPDDATIVRSTIELAHNLGLQVVAEGVETPSTWQALQQLGCDFGQGYHLSRPLPADRIAPFVLGIDAAAS